MTNICRYIWGDHVQLNCNLLCLLGILQLRAALSNNNNVEVLIG